MSVDVMSVLFFDNNGGCNTRFDTVTEQNRVMVTPRTTDSMERQKNDIEDSHSSDLIAFT